MIKRFLIVGLQLFCFVCVVYIKMTSGQNALDTPAASAFSQIRAAYWMIKPIDQASSQFQTLKTHGLNTALIKDSRYQIQENLLHGWGEVATRQNVLFFPVINFAGKNEMKYLRGTFAPYVDRTGTEFSSTPCPLDQKYWEASIGKRLEQIAALAKKSGIPGAIFDTEMYGSDFSIYHEPCFGDTCWERFMQAAGRNIPYIAQKHRHDYLTRHDHLKQYTNVQEKRLQEFLSSFEKRVHRINSSFSLGIIGFQQNWFYRGLIRGLGTVSAPLYVFSETSYISGYTPHVDQEMAFIQGTEFMFPFQADARNTQRHARYIPGVWLGRFFPDELPSQLYTLALHTDGYWLYSADSLWTDENQRFPLTLHGSHKTYWAAIKEANDQLNRYLRKPDTHQSPLGPLYPSSFYDDTQKRLILSESLEYFTNHVVSDYLGKISKSRDSHRSHETPSSQITYRGKALFHSIKNERGTIQITHIPLATYPDQTYYRLFDLDGVLIREGALNRTTPTITLSLPPHLSEQISLLIDSGANAARVSFSDLLWFVEASSTFPLAISNTIQTYRAYVRPDHAHLNLRAYCGGVETAFLTVQAPDKNVHRQTEIVGFTEIKIDIPALASPQQDGIFWDISLTPVPSKVFDDVKLYLFNEEFPYLIGGYEAN